MTDNLAFYFCKLFKYITVILTVSHWEEEPPKATRKRKAKTTSQTKVKSTTSNENQSSNVDDSSATQSTSTKSYAPVCQVLDENNEEIPPVESKKKSKNKYVFGFCFYFENIL